MAVVPSIHQVQSHTVEEYVWLIGKLLTALGGRYPASQVKGEYTSDSASSSYRKMDPPLIRVNLIALQVLHHILIIDTALDDPVIQAECDIIIVK